MITAKNTSRLPTSTRSRSGEPATANATSAVRPSPIAIQPYTFQRKAETRSAAWTVFDVHASMGSPLLLIGEGRTTAPPIVLRRAIERRTGGGSAAAGVA